MKNKIYWHKDGNESFLGRLYPIFAVYRNFPKKEYFLSIWWNPRSKMREMKVDSIQQGKLLAHAILVEGEREQNP
jgi:hypothetical protein